MIKEYKLIENPIYGISILLDDTNVDYYTDVSVILNYNGEQIELFKDNLLALNNIMEQKEVNVLEDGLDEKRLGLLINEYYRGIFENKIQEDILLDDYGNWIGEKYYFFMSLKYVTWIYKYGRGIVVKVTPIFNGFEKNSYFKQYSKFILEYRDVFREKISSKQLEYIKNIILNICATLLPKTI